MRYGHKKKVMLALLVSGFISVQIVAQDTGDSPVIRTTANNGNLVMEDVPPIPDTLVAELNRYQNVRSAPFLGFSADGNSLFISTRFGEVSQLHRVDMAGGARQQLTFFSEPVSGVRRQPGTDNVLFSMDAGGNEFAQLFLRDYQTGDSKMLTDGKSRNGAALWSEDGKQVAYASTRRNGSSNDLWAMNPDSPDQARLILESPDGSWWGPADWSQDSRHLLVEQYVSITDSRIYILDMKSGKRTLLSGSAEKPSVNSALAFSPDDKGFYFITDQFDEFSQLAYMTIANGSVQVITRDINWNVEEFAISKDGKRIAFAVNEDGFNSVYLMEPNSFQYRKADILPVGIVSGLEFDVSGKKLGMTMNTAQSPSDSFVLELGDKPTGYGKLQRWTNSEVGGLDTTSFARPELVRFKTFDDRMIPAFVYKPKSKGPHPVVISIHGGPESQFRPLFRSTYQLWIDRLGAAVIAPNVRGSSGYGREYVSLDNGFKREDSVKDIGALLDWVATQPDLDASRVAVFGGSYGGYMVLASTVHYSDRLKCAVDIVGISNFVTFLKNTQDYRRDLRRAEYGDERDPAMFKHLQSISPNNQVDKINVPMFVVQGQNDPRVPVTEAEQIVSSLRSQGKKVWYMNALNEGHGYRKKENRDIYTQAVLLFFEQHLLP